MIEFVNHHLNREGAKIFAVVDFAAAMTVVRRGVNWVEAFCQIKSEH